MTTKILVVDDEPDVLELLVYKLKEAGFSTDTAESGAQAFRLAKSFAPDLIILDLMLPEMDGLEVCKLLRRDPATAHLPIIMLTAKAAEMDRVIGLELGADDYLTKPFSPRELVLRVKNLLRRREPAAEKKQLYHFGNLTIDVPRHVVTVGKRNVNLTSTEFKLFALLAERRGRVQSREQLLKDVWEYEGDVDTRTVDTHMRRLRRKLGKAAAYLDTVRGVGYRFVDS